MKLSAALVGACTVASFFFASAWAQSKDGARDPKLTPADLTKCQLKVGEIERVDKVQLGDGATLSPSRRDAQLVLIQLTGTPDEAATVSIAPGLFGVNYVWRGMLRLGVAKAVGIRGKTPQGQHIERWIHEPDASMSFPVEPEGDPIRFWIAVEIPKDVREVSVRFPAVIRDQAQIPSAK